MWFKNLRIYNIKFDLHDLALDAALDAQKFVPCGNLDAMRRGFVPPIAGGENLIHTVNHCIMMCMKTQEKILPSAVVNAAVNERVKEIERAESRKVGRKWRQDLKDEVFFNLLPRAFVRDRLDYACIDFKNQRLIINTASTKRAEVFIHELRLAVGNLPCVPLQTDTNPELLMTEWVRQGYADAPFLLGESCELSAPKDGRNIKAKKQDLSSEEIGNHLSTGLRVQKLSLAWGEKLTFTLDEGLGIKQLKFSDLLGEQAGDRKPETAAEEFDAQFFIMSATIREFLSDLTGALGGEVAAENN